MSQCDVERGVDDSLTLYLQFQIATIIIHWDLYPISFFNFLLLKELMIHLVNEFPFFFGYSICSFLEFFIYHIYIDSPVINFFSNLIIGQSLSLSIRPRYPLTKFVLVRHTQIPEAPETVKLPIAYPLYMLLLYYITENLSSKSIEFN